MPKESCISHPTNAFFVKIYDYQMEMFDRDKSVCALLSLFESYHNSLLYNYENKKRIGVPTDETDLFQYHSYTQLEERIFGIGSRPTIIKSVKLLSENKIISIIDDEEISNYNSNLSFMQKVKNKSNPNIYRFNDDVFNSMVSDFLSKAGVKIFTTSGKNFDYPQSNFLPPPVKILTDPSKNFDYHNQNIPENNKNILNLRNSENSKSKKKEDFEIQDLWKAFLTWSKSHLTRSSVEILESSPIAIDGQSILIEKELSEFLKQIVLKYFNEEVKPPVIIIFKERKAI